MLQTRNCLYLIKLYGKVKEYLFHHVQAAAENFGAEAQAIKIDAAGHRPIEIIAPVPALCMRAGLKRAIDQRGYQLAAQIKNLKGDRCG